MKSGNDKLVEMIISDMESRSNLYQRKNDTVRVVAMTHLLNKIKTVSKEQIEEEVKKLWHTRELAIRVV